MRTIIGLAAFGWMLQVHWALILMVAVILAGLALFAWMWVQQILEVEPVAATWRRVEPRFEPWTTQEEPTNRSKLLHRIGQLEQHLKDAHGQIATLQAQNGRLVRDLQVARAAQPNSRSNPLFRRVGLSEDVPEWVARAVRREYRKRLHPDGRLGGQKVEAERRFKEAEGVFDQIWTIRGFRS